MVQRGRFDWAEDIAEVAVITLIVAIGLVAFSFVAVREWARRL